MYLMNKFKSLTKEQDGDTIIEVLISVVVVSIVLVSCYTIINAKTKTLLVAQQRAQATRLVESQIEELRTKGSFPANTKCFYISSGIILNSITSGNCNFSVNGSVNYALNIAYNNATTNYTVTATWPITSGTGNVTMEYRL